MKNLKHILLLMLCVSFLGASYSYSRTLYFYVGSIASGSDFNKGGKISLLVDGHKKFSKNFGSELWVPFSVEDTFKKIALNVTHISPKAHMCTDFVKLMCTNNKFRTHKFEITRQKLGTNDVLILSSWATAHLRLFKEYCDESHHWHKPCVVFSYDELQKLLKTKQRKMFSNRKLGE